ncbi:MAG: DUF4428 domain-containing protein [Eubacteriales bacterium]|nr:DUF4428 domain-containing protein [Eubacteriales bacterium]
MGLFGNLFKKQNCTLCGKECGTLGRTKLRDGEYVCKDCIRECSRYARVSEFTKEDLIGHIEYMKQQERIYNECFMSGKRNSYPSGSRCQEIVFCDEIGMFEIVDRKAADHKMYHELFRYDQVAGYEPYVKYGTAKEGGKEQPFEEYGVKITLYGARDINVGNEEELRGRRSHPYVKQSIVICFSKDEKEYNRADYSKNVIEHFDHIFGVNDDATALFSFKGSKNQQRQNEALKDMGKMFSATFKAAKAGEGSAEMEAAKEQFEKTKASADANLTHGLSKYSEAADAAEERCRW